LETVLWFFGLRVHEKEVTLLMGCPIYSRVTAMEKLTSVVILFSVPK